MKTKFSLIPQGALYRWADLLTKAGDGKHSDEKWRTMTVEDHVNAALRHINQHLQGRAVDRDYNHTHLVHALARLGFAAELQGQQEGD